MVSWPLEDKTGLVAIATDIARHRLSSSEGRGQMVQILHLLWAENRKPSESSIWDYTVGCGPAIVGASQPSEGEGHSSCIILRNNNSPALGPGRRFAVAIVYQFNGHCVSLAS